MTNSNWKTKQAGLAVILAMACASCAPQAPSPAPAPTNPPTPSRPAPNTQYPIKTSTPQTQKTATPAVIPSPTPPAAQWQTVRAGLEFYRSPARVNDADNVVVAVRINPASATFRVTYAPNAPKGVKDWLAETKAALVINGGYYTPQNTPLGLLISDGNVTGQSFRGFGGMFSVRDGKPALQWLAKLPYAADKKITQAAQSYPMLVWNGKITSKIDDDDQRSFRSFAGMDKQGRVIFGIAIAPVWTLNDLAQYLSEEPVFALDSALNLDGGGSTGLWVSGVSESLLMDSFAPVPSVIAVVFK